MVRFSLILLLLLVNGCSSSSEVLTKDECKTDQDCDDKIYCTKDICTISVSGAHVCQYIPSDELCPDGMVCLVSPPGCHRLEEMWCYGRKEGESCEPDDRCAISSGVCKEGVCVYDIKQCEVGECRVSKGCDPKSGECLWEPLADDTPCNEPSHPCTYDTCKSGICVEGAQDCDDGDPCTDQACLPDGSCVFYPHTCEDMGPCQEVVCISNKGCMSSPKKDGTPCGGPTECAFESSCQGGVCTPDPKPDGTPCIDPTHLCTYDTCQNGVCVEGPPDCDDNDPCTDDTCLIDGSCAFSPHVCDDHDPCTADQCKKGVGCVFEPISPCCGNAVVEGTEQCDSGATSTQACIECGFSSFDAANEVTGYPSVAWSNSSGLIVYETTEYAMRALYGRQVLGNGELMNPNLLLTATVSTGVSEIAHSMSAIPGGYLVAGRTGSEITILKLNENGVPKGGTQILTGQTTGRILLTRTGDKVIVAWNTAITYELWVSIGSFDLKFSDPIMLSPTDSMLISACGGDEGALISFVTSEGSLRRNSVVPIDKDGNILTPKELSIYKCDYPMGSVCAPHPSGFIAVISDGYISDSGVIQTKLSSILLDEEANPIDMSVTLDSAASDGKSSIAFCLSGLAVLVPTLSNFMLVCPFIEFDGATPTGLQERFMVLDLTGNSMGPFSDISSNKDAGFIAATPVGSTNQIAPGAVLTVWEEGEWGDTQIFSLRGSFLMP